MHFSETGIVNRPLTAEAKAKYNGGAMVSFLIGCFNDRRRRRNLLWAADNLATNSRLANLLNLLVVLVCLGAIVQRVLPPTF
ncbi:hypothetical protein IVA95_29855 [Bradyrhizobium sp. 157]|uniref:hypothetical protein n=1 Tax=Bradyrhizobium sp. 157 TaxID=2782631 RepID=UPI001FF95E01|nr:hypothetical protein [Bradyrhizobium sp. 157]MCK1641634.1 hypothetical protein [Bradyrhizobium sp. 157]